MRRAGASDRLPIRIHVETAAESLCLVDLLARRGLTGRPRIQLEGGWDVLVMSVRDDARTLAADVAAALRIWLADEERDSIALAIGDRDVPVGALDPGQARAVRPAA
jgi:hypothetical protein